MQYCICGHALEHVPIICDSCGRWVDVPMDDAERADARPWCFAKRSFLHELLTVDRAQLNEVMASIITLVTSGPTQDDTTLAVPGFTPLAQRLIGKHRLVYAPPAPPATTVPTLVGISRLDDPRPRVPIGVKNIPPGVFDRKLLFQIRLPSEIHDDVLAVKTLEHLVRLQIAEQHRSMLFDIALEPDWRQRVSSRDHVVESAHALDAFVVDEEYLEFALRLDPDQERLVERILNGEGPFVVRGAPGTGKTTMALYGIKKMVNRLARQGLLDNGRFASAPILYVSYTNTLIQSAQQQLEALLGVQARHVEVRTIDSIVGSILWRWQSEAGKQPDLYDEVPEGNASDEDDVRAAMDRAMTRVQFTGDQQRVTQQQRAISRLGVDFLLQEAEHFIAGRNITTIGDYLAADRTGRGVGLNAIQREAVWNVTLAFRETLAAQGLSTWSERRRLAATAGVWLLPRYKAVFVDEAQDFDPVATQMLHRCCPDPKRLFITADANQTIYQTGFLWADSGMWADEEVTPRTYTLKTNHRTTRQIERATRAFLAAGSGLMDDGFGETVVRAASRVQREMEGPLPRQCEFSFDGEMAGRLAASIRQATQHHRIGYGLCAVLVPTNAKAKAVAAWLNEQKVPAAYMHRGNLDLSARVVKVMTYHSSKGLEFPFVVLTGFDSDHHPGLPKLTKVSGEIDQQAIEEAVARSRRAIYVGMTRATRELLVITPPNPSAHVARIFQGIGGDLWAKCGPQA